MDHPIRQQKFEIVLTGLRAFNGALNWLASLVLLTEKEQYDAGIYLGDHPYQ